MSSALAALLLLLTLGGVLSDENLNSFGAWKTGRGTFYGTDAWSIHEGACAYGHLSPGEPLGWNVAAMSDAHPLYAAGKSVCGFCIEVQCAPITISDNYGATFDRTGSCYGVNASVVVRITDSCPCTYPSNGYSNKRWCCGDMDHFDLSYITFQAIAPLYWGVIGLIYRQVPCNYIPNKQAAIPYYADQDPTYNPAVVLPLRDWPEYVQPAPPLIEVYGDYQGFASGFVNGSWQTMIAPYNQTKVGGVGGRPALCAQIKNWGALALLLWPPTNNVNVNPFARRTKLSFWIYVGVAGDSGTQAKVADITISLSGAKGACTRQRIFAVPPTQFVPSCTYCTDMWWLYEFHLGGFSGGDPRTPIRPGDFQGCGGNSLSDLQRIEFRNDGFGGNGDKYFCLSHIRLI